MVKYSLNERKERARQLHKQGYNCSQCVVMAFDDINGLSEELAARIASGFGGGVGGQRQVCGAVSGMTILEGITYPGSPTEKLAIYSAVKSNSEAFKAINGSIVCGDLLKPGRKPCIELIEDAITIIDSKLR